jgi:arsenite methyltransferase
MIMNDKEITNRKPINTREWYDFVGQLADALPGMHMGGLDATQRLVGMCHLDANSRVLDVGCGNGITACLIAEKFGAHVEGIDISAVMIAKAKEKAHRQGLTAKVTFRVGDAFDLPFDDDTFDVVLVESVLTPLPGDKKQALAEMVRVTRAGGRIGVNESTVDPSAPAEWLALLDEHPAIHGYFTPETLRNLIAGSGLQVVEMFEAQYVSTPQAFKEMGLRGVLSFMFQSYPKILLNLIRDARIREAGRIDDQITKRGKEYMGYVLIIGQKPG